MKNKEQLPKERAIYQAVIELFQEGADLNALTVAEITARAGIGKGTAYEYFSDKEEMIAKGIFFGTVEFCRMIYERLTEEKSLYDKIYLILLKIEREVTEINCILRMIHLMSDNSATSRKLKKMMDDKSGEQILPTDIVRRMIIDEWKEESELESEKLDYLCMRTFSGILCYGMYVDEGSKNPSSKELVREMTCRGICREVQEVLSGPDGTKRQKKG